MSCAGSSPSQTSWNVSVFLRGVAEVNGGGGELTLQRVWCESEEKRNKLHRPQICFLSVEVELDCDVNKTEKKKANRKGKAASCCSPQRGRGTHPAPVERPGEVISCSQRKDCDGRLGVHLQLVQRGQDPAHLPQKLPLPPELAESKQIKAEPNQSGSKRNGSSPCRRRRRRGSADLALFDTTPT